MFVVAIFPKTFPPLTAWKDSFIKQKNPVNSSYTTLVCNRAATIYNSDFAHGVNRNGTDYNSYVSTGWIADQKCASSPSMHRKLWGQQSCMHIWHTSLLHHLRGEPQKTNSTNTAMTSTIWLLQHWPNESAAEATSWLPYVHIRNKQSLTNNAAWPWKKLFSCSAVIVRIKEHTAHAIESGDGLRSEPCYTPKHWAKEISVNISAYSPSAPLQSTESAYWDWQAARTSPPIALVVCALFLTKTIVHYHRREAIFVASKFSSEMRTEQ